MAEENTKAASGKIKEEEVKKVALTFDDGPNPDHTETLLEGLKERNVKATFFLLGAECEKISRDREENPCRRTSHRRSFL